MKSILCILAVALALIAQATPVTPFQAKQAARAWAQRNAAFAGEDAIDASLTAVAVTNAEGVTLWYRVSLNNGSCIVVSPVTELEPVIACLENVPKNGLPSGHPMRAMLERDMADRLKKLGLYTSAPTGPTLMGAAPTASQATPADPVMVAWAEQGKAKWARLAGGTGGIQLMAAVTNGVDDAGMAEIVCVAKGFEKGGPLTHWNQEEDKLGKKCYNLYTPNNYPCGCVATAMAAMLQFFGANATKANYSPEGDGCKVDGVAINAVTMSGGGDLVPEGVEYYDWSLLDDMTSLSDYADDSKMNDDIRDLLGRVAYDAGVMLSMEWGWSGSGANTEDIAKALKAFQKVDIDSETSTGLRACAVLNPAENQYEKLIYFPCRLGKPVGLGINQEGGGTGGHAVLAVGFGWDDESNARVRIFAGWGGIGDGWYALPYINTKSLPSQAGSFLYDVVKKVVTLIGYEDESRVPLVGRVGKPEKVGGTLTLMPAGTPVTVSENGYFGLCDAPPPPSAISLEAAEYKASIWLSSSLANLLGKDSLKPGELCAALPDEIFFETMNCSVAYSFDQALEYARNENKALLRVSGMMHEEATSNLVERIRAIDEEDVTFKDKFVYFFTSANSSADLADGNPSIGVFLPSEVEQSGRWQYTNGRLAYGYVYALDEEWVESAVNDESDEVTNIVRSVVRNGFRANYGAETKDFRYVDIEDGVANDCPHDDFAAALEAMTQFVIDSGWVEYCRRTQGISLTVTASPEMEFGLPDPAFGVHVNAFTNGQKITAFAPGELVTNTAAGVVMGYSGWTLTNETTGVFLQGTGTNTTPFTVMSNDVLTLTWQMETNAVWISVRDADGGGTTSPGTGWYPYGKSVAFVAVANEGFVFDQWVSASGKALPEAVSFEAFPQWPVLVFVAEEPFALAAYYNNGSIPDECLEERHALTVSSLDSETGTEMTSFYGLMAPVTVVVAISGRDAETVNMGGTVNDLPAVGTAVSMENDTFMDGEGNTWRCVGWRIRASDSFDYEYGAGSAVGVALREDCELIWLWEKVVPAGPTRRPLVDPDDVPVAADGVSSPLTIYANSDGTFTVEAAIGNAVAGWWYVLKTASDLDGPYVKADGDECVKLAVEDGKKLELSTTFTPTDNKQFYKVTVEGEAP